MAADGLCESLKKYFGHAGFRKPQDEIVSSILSGRDTLAIMPTGGGKSLCYQLPAVMQEGVALVVSPLIALMKDQVDALAARGIAAAMINSSQTWEQQKKVLASLGDYKLAYVAPERFRSRSFIEALRRVKISLFAVDEAHCISQWGHDFRPDYARLGEALEKLGRPVCAAFTATATPDVREDIVRQLDLRNPAVFVSGFARPNLSFNVSQVSGREEKVRRICDIIARHRTGIVYCATRKSVETLSELLAKKAIGHIVYHGAMSPSERDEAQETFIGKKVNVAVATNAFGMGIDRPDIRFVCHYELTGSVEALYQESGRAGRDGGEAYCEMLMMYSDKRVQEFFIDGANPEAGFIRRVYALLRQNANPDGECVMSNETIAELAAAGMGRGGMRRGGGRKSPNSMAVSSALSALRRRGYIERFDVPAARIRGTKILDTALSAEDLDLPQAELDEKRMRDENKLRDVLRYAYTNDCRQKWILDYFGEPTLSACGKCDNCREFYGAAAARKSDVLTPKQALVVRKALSGIVRLSRRVGARQWQPRFGRDRIVKSLVGSSDAKILNFGLDKISTHGILAEYGRKFVADLLDAMQDAGYIRTLLDGEFPLTGITDEGISVLFDDSAEIKLAYPDSAAKPSGRGRRSSKLAAGGVSGGVPVSAPSAILPVSDKSQLSDSDRELFEFLSKERMKLAVARKVKAYQIFSNATLLEFAQKRPRTLEEAAQVKGIGAAKLESLAPKFIKLLEEFEERG